MSIDKATAQTLVQEFLDEFKGLEQVKFRILHDQADYLDAYGPNADMAMQAWADKKAAYFPASKEIHIATHNHDSPDDFRDSLAHEGIGHAGINTFDNAEKRALLDAIISTQDKPGVLGDVFWRDARSEYPQATLDMQAEEVYCLTVEHFWKDRNANAAAFKHAWQESVANRNDPLPAWGLVQIGQHVAQGLRDNTRLIQITPSSNDALFRADPARQVTEDGPRITGPGQHSAQDAIDAIARHLQAQGFSQDHQATILQRCRENAQRHEASTAAAAAEAPKSQDFER